MRPALVDDVLRGDDAATFATARRLGFAGVEVQLRRSELRSTGQERLASLRQARAESGLTVTSLILGWHSDGGLADRSGDVAAAAEEDVRQALGWATELGATAILVPFFGRGELHSDDDLDRAAAAFRRLCPLAATAGVELLYEGTLPAARVRRLADEVRSDAFGCYFDLANLVARGLDSPTEIRALGELIRRVHFKDTRVTTGDCPPGLGRVDFAESARALAETGYDGWLVLETPPGPPPLVGRDLSFARTVFPDLAPVAAQPRFGAFSYDFRRGEWERLNEAFGELGLVAVQLGTELLEECLERSEAIERLDGGIDVVGLAGYRNLIAPDPAIRQANVEAIVRCLEVAPHLRTSVVATETGTRSPEGDWIDSPENSSPEAWRLLDEALEPLVAAAEANGVVLALEASVKNVLKTVGQLIGLFDRFPSRHLQLVCDPYNYLSSHLIPAQERHTRDFLDRFEHRFVIAHGKDVDAGGAEVATQEFGLGVFEQQPYLEFLRTRRPDLPLVLEHLPIDHVPDAIGRVRSHVST
jgi:sugar phosphate isomerase/epimerase